MKGGALYLMVWLIAFKENIKTCYDLAHSIAKTIEYQTKGYAIGYVIFDVYSVNNSIKDATRKRRTAGKSSSKGYLVDGYVKTKDFTAFLSSTQTKGSLTLI